MALVDSLPTIPKGVNNFLTWAEQGRVPETLLDDATYRTHVRRKTGFVGGEPADAALMNTALRNITQAMKGLTDFVAQNGVNVSELVTADEIRAGLLTCINNAIANRVAEVTTPILQNMQAQIDSFARVYHGVPVGGILPISVSQEGLAQFLQEYPYFAVCDGQNGTIDLRDRFIMGAGVLAPQGQMGGSRTYDGLTVTSHTLTENEIPKHKHEAPGSQSAYAVDKWPYGAPIGSDEYMGSSSVDKGFRVYTSSTGGNQGHSHGIRDTMLVNGVPSGKIPPYYSLIFVQKIRPY